jgi:hypothetical protein
METSAHDKVSFQGLSRHFHLSARGSLGLVFGLIFVSGFDLGLVIGLKRLRKAYFGWFVANWLTFKA